METINNLQFNRSYTIDTKLELSILQQKDIAINAKISGFNNWINPININNELVQFCNEIGLNITYSINIDNKAYTIKDINKFYNNIYYFRQKNIYIKNSKVSPITVYLDDFNIINIYGTYDNKEFYLKHNNTKIPLLLQSINDTYKTYTFNESYNFNNRYILVDNYNNEYPITTRNITKSIRFDNEYKYTDNDLGITYTKNNTIFKVWAPVSYKVLLLLDNTLYPMEKVNNVYTTKVNIDTNNLLYNFVIYNSDSIDIVLDPYGYSSNANNLRSAIIDINKYKVKQHYNFKGEYSDSIIYELSLRDFLYDYKEGSYFKRNTIKGLKNNDMSIGLDHIIDLGITHVQLMPVLDFVTVDENNPNEMYNWGYDPVQFFTLEGSLSTNPNNPYDRVIEFKELIDTYHKNNIFVNIDVVFNHVYMTELFAYNTIVPYYFIRYKDNIKSNGSYCGNDLESNSYMMKKYLTDICKYFVNYFDIDGLRFDLMGILDIDTINQITREVRKIKPNFMIYGEGWNMPTLIDDKDKAMDSNHLSMDNVAYFNDTFRNCIKNLFVEYIDGDDLKNSILGNKFNDINKTINYIECHDNHTIYDYLKLHHNTNILDKIMILNTIVLLSNGISFIHSGQEFARSKHGHENTYNLSDKINKIHWNDKKTNINLYRYTKELIKLRNNDIVFRKGSPNTKLEFNNNLLYYYLDKYLIIFNMRDTTNTLTLPDNYCLLLSSKSQTSETIKALSVNIYKID